jgi:5-methylcytosine-specific restriction endonuclease McrA
MTLILILWQGIVAFFACAFWLFVLWLICRPHGQAPKGMVQPVRPQDRPEFEFLFGQACVRCGSTDQLAWDHIVPASWGGSDGIENLQRMCRQCNQDKGATYADYRSAEQRQWIEDRL